MKYKEINYYDGGVISVHLAKNDTKEFDRAIVYKYLEFPATSSMRVIGIDEENFEEVVDLLRFVRSTSEIPIACYYEGTIQDFRLKPFADIIIKVDQISS